MLVEPSAQWEVIGPTPSGFRKTLAAGSASLMPNSSASKMAASIVQEIKMSDPVLPPREAITIVRAESNGPLYLLVGLIALGRSWPCVLDDHFVFASWASVHDDGDHAGPARRRPAGNFWRRAALARSSGIRQSPPRFRAGARLAGAAPSPDPALALGPNMSGPSQLKAATWGAIGGGVGAAIVAFALGGWVTGNAADDLVTPSIDAAALGQFGPTYDTLFSPPDYPTQLSHAALRWNQARWRARRRRP